MRWFNWFNWFCINSLWVKGPLRCCKPLWVARCLAACGSVISWCQPPDTGVGKQVQGSRTAELKIGHRRAFGRTKLNGSFLSSEVLTVFLKMSIVVQTKKSLYRKKRYSISDDDFINHYNASSIIHNNNKGKNWHKLIILGDDISSLLFIAFILYSIFG